MLRTKKTLLFIALGVISAQVAILLTPKTVSAKTELGRSEGSKESCVPKPGYICSYQGHAYANYALMSEEQLN